MGLATTMYPSENLEKFPFVNERWPRMAFIDTWALLQPYISTNGSFYLCPADHGPNNLVLTRLFASMNLGIRTNELRPNSYWYWMAFYSKGSDWSLVPQQRSVSDVLYPSQKIIMDCEAIGNVKQEVSSDGDLPQAHGKGRFTTLFVDGHASITWYPIYAANGDLIGGTRRPGSGVLQPDPGGPSGWGMGSLGWADVP